MALLFDLTTSVLIAIGVSSFTVFVTRKDHGKVQFAAATIFSWITVLITAFATALDSFVMAYNPALTSYVFQSVFFILTVAFIIWGFMKFGD